MFQKSFSSVKILLKMGANPNIRLLADQSKTSVLHTPSILPIQIYGMEAQYGLATKLRRLLIKYGATTDMPIEKITYFEGKEWLNSIAQAKKDIETENAFQMCYFFSAKQKNGPVVKRIVELVLEYLEKLRDEETHFFNQTENEDL